MIRRNFNSNLKGNIMIDLGKVSEVTMGAGGHKEDPGNFDKFA